MADPGLPVSNPTTSYWQQAHPDNMANIQSTTLPACADVVIVGSGITGCSVATSLLTGDPGLLITMLEARTLCSGATGRNGGHIKCVPVTDYPRLLKQLGHDAAAQVIRFVMMHYDHMLASARELGADRVGQVRPVTAATVVCDSTREQELRDAHALFESSFPEYKGVYKFYNGPEAREKLGLEVGFAAMTGSAGAAWPYRLVTAIFRELRRVHGSHFRIETSTPATQVTQIHHDAYRYRVQTPRGSIVTGKVVYCAEAHTSHLIPGLRGLIFPLRGQMSVQKSDAFPVARSEFSWSFVYKNSFDYMCQNAETGELFLGGGGVLPEEEEHEFLANPSDAAESITGRMHLRGVVPTVFGGSSTEVKATWTGVMGFSLDGLPLVGRLPSQAHGSKQAPHDAGEWIAAGFGGYGMVNCWLSGKAVAQQILGHPLPEWFPESYLITSARLARLNALLSSKLESAVGIKSLL